MKNFILHQIHARYEKNVMKENFSFERKTCKLASKYFSIYSSNCYFGIFPSNRYLSYSNRHTNNLKFYWIIIDFYNFL